jgi:membrane peptidoglycan carboxypeptidase
MMQGVLARGTAQSIADLAPYVAGKTGTSDDENDAWFVGFTNEVTVAVWVGYDNADGKRRTLGSGATGGGVAVPIFEPVMRAVWNDVAPRTALAPPSPEAKRDLSCASVDEDSGEVRRRGTRTISECLRIDAKGGIIDTTMALLESGGSRHAKNRQAKKKRDYEEAPPKKNGLARAASPIRKRARPRTGETNCAAMGLLWQRRIWWWMVRLRHTIRRVLGTLIGLWVDDATYFNDFNLLRRTFRATTRCGDSVTVAGRIMAIRNNGMAR